MKKTLLSFTMISAMLFVSCGEEKADGSEESGKESTTTEKKPKEDMETTLNLDTEASTIKWHSQFKQDPDHYHQGEFKFSSGTITMKDNQIVSGSFEVDVNSITETAPKTDSASLMKHLKSPEFLNVEEFPISTFEITEAANGKVTGNLTILGITKEVSFMSSITATPDKLIADATLPVNKLDFGITTMSSEDGTDPEKQILPEVKLEVHIEAYK